MTIDLVLSVAAIAGSVVALLIAARSCWQARKNALRAEASARSSRESAIRAEAYRDITLAAEKRLAERRANQ